MKHLAFCALFFLSVTCAHAQENQVSTYFKALYETSKQNCSNLKQLKEKYIDQKRDGAAESVQATMQNFCTCMPTQIKKARSKYKKQLKTKVSENQFLKIFQPFIDKCAAEQMQYTYGKKCSTRFKEAKQNSTRYCKCMKKYIKGLSNAQISQIGRESSEYMKAAKVSTELGIKPPPKPRLYDAFLKQDSTCEARY